MLRNTSNLWRSVLCWWLSSSERPGLTQDSVSDTAPLSIVEASPSVLTFYTEILAEWNSGFGSMYMEEDLQLSNG